MTTTISCKLAALGILAMAISCAAPAAALVKPAGLGPLPNATVLVQQQDQQQQDDQQDRPQKPKAKKKKMSREDEAKAKARKYLPPEYHQYIPR